MIALAVFLPIISDMSGCSGNQAVAVSMRELSLGVVKPFEVLYVAATRARYHVTLPPWSYALFADTVGPAPTGVGEEPSASPAPSQPRSATGARTVPPSADVYAIIDFETKPPASGIDAMETAPTMHSPAVIGIDRYSPPSSDAFTVPAR